MDNVDILREFKEEINGKYAKFFTGEVRFHYRNKGMIKWIASRDKLNIIYANLLRTITSKNNIKELNKLKRSISSNKFSTQFGLFVKFYTNNYGSMEDVKSTNCPKLTPVIPMNQHSHDKHYFVTIIVDWYISYFLWQNKMRHTAINTDIRKKEVNSSHDNSDITINDNYASDASDNIDADQNDKNTHSHSDTCDLSYCKASVDSFGSYDSDDAWYTSFKQSTNTANLENKPVFDDLMQQVPDCWDD